MHSDALDIQNVITALWTLKKINQNTKKKTTPKKPQIPVLTGEIVLHIKLTDHI